VLAHYSELWCTHRRRDEPESEKGNNMTGTTGGRYVRFRRKDDDTWDIMLPPEWKEAGVIHWYGNSWWVEFRDDNTPSLLTDKQHAAIGRKVDRLKEERDAQLALKAMGPWTWKVIGIFYDEEWKIRKDITELAGSGHGYKSRTAALEAARYVAARTLNAWRKPSHIELHRCGELADVETL
jgi:hypothetical protein